jgi:DNA-directed RNA polymerase specialized sigma24 family protein
LASEKRKWVLTQPAFQALLGRLSSNRIEAAEEYEQLRLRLITFFRCRGSRTPEDRADDTLDRVSRRLNQGDYIRSLFSFVTGVAQLVSKEDSRAARKEAMALLASAAKDDPTPPTDLEQIRVDCVRRCLSKLEPEARELILDYFAEDATRILSRRELADKLGLSPVALRIRVHRLRAKLFECTKRCIQQELKE